MQSTISLLNSALDGDGAAAITSFPVSQESVNLSSAELSNDNCSNDRFAPNGAKQSSGAMMYNDVHAVSRVVSLSSAKEANFVSANARSPRPPTGPQPSKAGRGRKGVIDDASPSRTTTTTTIRGRTQSANSRAQSPRRQQRSTSHRNQDVCEVRIGVHLPLQAAAVGGHEPPLEKLPFRQQDSTFAQPCTLLPSSAAAVNTSVVSAVGAENSVPESMEESEVRHRQSSRNAHAISPRKPSRFNLAGHNVMAASSVISHLRTPMTADAMNPSSPNLLPNQELLPHPAVATAVAGAVRLPSAAAAAATTTPRSPRAHRVVYSNSSEARRNLLREEVEGSDYAETQKIKAAMEATKKRLEVQPTFEIWSICA
jgi:hypothetical protein